MRIILGGIGILMVGILFFQLTTEKVFQEIRDSQKLGATLPSVVVLPLVPKLKIKIYPSDILYQGEAMRIEVEGFNDSPPPAVFEDKEYKFFKYQGKWNAVIPLGVGARVGEHKIKIGDIIYPIKVMPGIFLVEEIPPFKPLIETPAQIARRQKEVKTIARAYQSVIPKIYFNSDFIYPLAHFFETSPFGVQRVIKTTAQKLEPHNGVDLRAERGTPVRAINDGLVEIASHYLLEGGFVLLDHGWGINSGYLHLSKVNVKEGELVKKGQIIGLVGSSGQASGPHLHFMVKINGVAVNPLRFLDLWK